MLSKTKFDVLIFGGGPAGISAGIWADELGLSSALVDRGSRLGGQLHNVHNTIKNYAGAEFRNGAEMTGVLERQIARRSTKLLLDREVVAVDTKRRVLTFSDGETISGRYLILATGVRRRVLGVPGEREFFGKGILDSGAKDPTTVGGQTVAIVGGGDAALENAVILANYAKRVTIVHRRETFFARPGFISQIEKLENVERIFDSEIIRFSGSETLESIEIRNNNTNSIEKFPVTHALIRVGFQPNSELYRHQVDCDDLGYVRVDRNCATAVSGTFAVGDVTRPNSQTISTAIGDSIAPMVLISRMTGSRL